MTDARVWWRGPDFDAGNFHLLAGAGLDVNAATRRIYIADPDSNNGSDGAASGITTNAFVAAPAIAAGATPGDPRPAFAAVAATPGVIEVDSARKYTAAEAVPIPARVVAGDGSTRVLAAGFESKYGFWDIAADGFTITGSDNAGVAADPAPGSVRHGHHPRPGHHLHAQRRCRRLAGARPFCTARLEHHRLLHQRHPQPDRPGDVLPGPGRPVR